MLLLMREGKANDQLRLAVEGLDDVSFHQGDSPVQLIQTKHHIDRSASLTNTSGDLWRTLRVWADRARTGLVHPGPVVLVLMTTATAPDGSAAALLRPTEINKDRNEERAHQLLLEAISTSRNKALAEAFQAFRELAVDQRRTLLSAVRILDRAPDIVDVRKEIGKDLDLFVRPEQTGAFADRVEGWWLNRVVAALAGIEERTTSYMDLRTHVRQLRDRFNEEDLPADFPDAIELSVDELAADERVFVEQLRLVAASELRIRKAVGDYWRAYQQRSRWVEDGLLYDHDLERYENVLVDEWQRYFDGIEHRLREDASEDEVRRAGYDLFHRIDTDVDKPIRRNFREGYVQRGTYHGLANDLRVGWHRNFVSHLQHIVNEARQRAS
ncbi:ABC-three component system protein [Rubrobacter radiotolerans]|nr:ABC-three component system protein [Rubrobacter radiotolerans]